MGDRPISEILDFGGTNSSKSSLVSGPGMGYDTESATNSISHLPSASVSTSSITSHLSQRPRSDSNSRINVKRIKPSNKINQDTSEDHSLRQLELSRQQVHEAIDNIFQDDPLRFGYGYYYQKVESICKYKHSEQSKLSDYLKTAIERHFYDQVKPGIQTLVNNPLLTEHQFIHDYLLIYESWESKLRLLGKIFLYIDRGYLLQHPNKKMILELGLNLFITNLLMDPIDDADITINKYLLYLKQFIEHDDDVINNPPDELSMTSDGKDDLTRFSKMLIKLDYSKLINLNNTLINLISKNFELLKDQWFKHFQNYIHLALSKISKIITFFKNCGQPKEFTEKLLIRLKWVMIFQDFNEIISHCLPIILSLNNSKQILMIYKFCEKTMTDYGLDSMRIFVYQWGKLIMEEIDKAVADFDDKNSGSSSTNTKNIIILLHNINNHYSQIVTEKFNHNEKFQFEIRNSFNKSLNNNKKTNQLIINQLCKFIDLYFKNYNSSNAVKKLGLQLTFDEFANIFEKIFKYLNNKNDFILIFKRELSRRLLLNKNISNTITLEKQFVDLIIDIVGETDDSIGLLVMFKDLDNSKLKYTNMEFIKDMEFSSLILEKKYWPEIPKQQMNDIELPQKFNEILRQFNEFYINLDDKLKNHQLTWDNYSLHQLTILSHFDSGDYELTVNLFQAVIFELFNDKPSWDFHDIMQATNIESKFLRRIITSLSDKYKILIDHNDNITLNVKFSDKSKKLKIPMLRESQTNVVEEKIITRNRTLEIRSSLVKIMKCDTKLSVSELLHKSLMILNNRGPIAIQEIKKNIEYLIDNEFLTRDHDGKSLTYVP